MNSLTKHLNNSNNAFYWDQFVKQLFLSLLLTIFLFCQIFCKVCSQAQVFLSFKNQNLDRIWRDSASKF